MFCSCRSKIKLNTNYDIRKPWRDMGIFNKQTKNQKAKNKNKQKNKRNKLIVLNELCNLFLRISNSFPRFTLVTRALEFQFCLQFTRPVRTLGLAMQFVASNYTIQSERMNCVNWGNELLICENGFPIQVNGLLYFFQRYLWFYLKIPMTLQGFRKDTFCWVKLNWMLLTVVSFNLKNQVWVISPSLKKKSYIIFVEYKILEDFGVIRGLIPETGEANR